MYRYKTILILYSFFVPVHHLFPPSFQPFLRYPWEAEPEESGLYKISTHKHDEISVKESSQKIIT